MSKHSNKNESIMCILYVTEWSTENWHYQMCEKYVKLYKQQEMPETQTNMGILHFYRQALLKSSCFAC